MADSADQGSVQHGQTQNSALRDAFMSIDYLLKRFWLERYCYLACAVIAVGLLIWAVARTLLTTGLATQEMGALFGSTGIFGLTSLGVLYIFKRAFALVDRALSDKSK